jgi:hypothetical protein
MLSYTDNEVYDAASNLENAYHCYLTQDLGPQIIYFMSSFKTNIKQCTNVYDLAFMLIVEKACLSYNISGPIYSFFLVTAYTARYCLCTRALFF